MTSQTENKKAIKPKRGRAETEQRLIDVALELIRNNGILAGLNLREVAEAAGVNRGNIYHYFGSRQELLRTGINRRFEAMIESFTAGLRRVPFVQQRLRTFKLVEESDDSILRALLVADGDTSVDPMPYFEEGLSQTKQSVLDGEVHKDHDLEALQIAISGLTRGYSIFREPYAKRLNIPVEELDQRVKGIYRTWLEAMSNPPSSNKDNQ